MTYWIAYERGTLATAAPLKQSLGHDASPCILYISTPLKIKRNETETKQIVFEWYKISKLRETAETFQDILESFQTLSKCERQNRPEQMTKAEFILR